jgi:small subunit ribosomal protein S6
MAQAQAGKIPGYETTFITRGEMAEEGLKSLNERIKGIVASFGGEIVLQEDWGSRKLAYPIQKEVRGKYTYVVYTGTGEIVHEIERNLRLHDHVLRFLTVNLEKEFEGEGFKKRRIELQAAAKKREEEREARREERAAERRGSYGDDRGDRGDYRRGPGGPRPIQAEAGAEASEGAEE